jgi:hypothetical protein
VQHMWVVAAVNRSELSVAQHAVIGSTVCSTAFSIAHRRPGPHPSKIIPQAAASSWCLMLVPDLTSDLHCLDADLPDPVGPHGQHQQD